MHKTTKLWFSTILLITLILTTMLLWIYEDQKTYSFDAYIREVHLRYDLPSFSIIEPVGSNNFNYSELKAVGMIAEEGQKVRITAKREYREVYPPMIEVISYEIY